MLCLARQYHPGELVFRLQRKDSFGRSVARGHLLPSMGFSLAAALALSSAADARPPASDDEAGPLEVIRVTARRTEERLQDVPQSVSVLSGAEIQKANLADIGDAILRLPNVSFAEGSSPIDTNISIRGLSNFIAGGASGPVVAVYVDEVLVNPGGGSSGIDTRLLDLQRVETAYGPQGASFGRGAIGGILNFVTEKPNEEFGGELQIEGGSFSDALVRGMLNGSLTGDERLSYRAVAFVNSSEGFVDYADPDVSGSVEEDGYGARLALRSRPTEALTLDFSASFERTNFDASNAASIESIEEEDQLLSLNNFRGDNQLDKTLLTARAEYNAAAGDIIATVSYFNASADLLNDTDFTPLDFFTQPADLEEGATTAEVRFQSDSIDLSNWGSLSYSLGATVGTVKFEQDATVVPGDDAFRIIGLATIGQPLPNDGSTVRNLFDQDISTLGLFFDTRWRPVERVEITIGGRFTEDEVEYIGEQISSGITAITTPPIPFNSGAETFSEFTPRASLLFEASDNVSLYASVSTGFRAGGFNSSADFVGVSFAEETAISYEAGLKSTWLDERLQFTVGLFEVDYDDLQVSSIAQNTGVPAAFTTNAASATSQGAEVSVRWAPNSVLSFSADYGYTDATFDEFTTSPFGDLSRSRLPNAPKHTLSVVADAQFDIVFGSFSPFVRAEYISVSEFRNLLNPGDLFSLEGYDLVNLRGGIRSDQLTLELFVENAFDEFYATGTTSLTATAFTGQPSLDAGETRRWGGRLIYSF